MNEEQLLKQLESGTHLHRFVSRGPGTGHQEVCYGGGTDCFLWNVQATEALEAWSEN